MLSQFLLKRHLSDLSTCAFLAALCICSADPAPASPPPPVVHDQFTPVDPSAVRLKGLLGEYQDAIREHFVLYKDIVSKYLEPLEKHGDKFWQSEHIGKWLGAAQKKLAIESGEAAPAAIGKDVAEKYPELSSVISDYPGAEELHQQMLNSPGVQGDKYRAQVKNFVQDQSNRSLESIGYSPEDIEKIKLESPDQRGQRIVDAITKDVGEKYEPFKQHFDKLEEKYREMPLTPEDKGNLSLRLAEMAKPWDEVPNAPEAKQIRNIIESVKDLKTVDGVRLLRRSTAQTIDNQGLWNLKDALKILDDSKASVVLKSLGEEEGPAALKFHSDLNEEYGQFKDQIYELNKRLHVKGANDGPGIFMNGLKDMNPATVLNRLNPKTDAGLVGEISKIPGVAEIVKEHNLDQLVKGATAKDQFNLGKFVKNVDNLTPENRKFLMSDEAYNEIKGMAKSVQDLPTTINPSGTGRAGMGMFSMRFVPFFPV